MSRSAEPIAALLPPSVCVVATSGDLGDDLLPGEEAVVGRGAVDGRRREFATGRACARRALIALGRSPAPVCSGPRGEPIWPSGVVGSITHTTGCRAAAVGDASAILAIGIDAEAARALPLDVLMAVATPTELQRLREHPGNLGLDVVLFSAKEAIFKAWFSLTGLALGARDLDVHLDPATRTFRARSTIVDGRFDHYGLAVQDLEGRWGRRGSAVVTTVVLFPDRPRSAATDGTREG